MAPTIPSRSNSSLRGRPPSDAARADSEAFNDAVRQVRSTGSVNAAARKLALYAKMTGGAPPTASPDPPSAAPTSTRPAAQADVEITSPARVPRRPQGASATIKPSTQPAKPDPFDDPEEQAYRSAHQNGYAEEDDCAIEDEDMEEQDKEAPIVHLQEIVEGLWVGDLVAAMDTDGLRQRGITNILSLLRPKIQFTSDFSVFPLEIDDSPDTDILTHLPTCVAWIGEALRRRARAREKLRRSSNSSLRSSQGHAREATPPDERDVLIRHLPQTAPGGVLVHCQAGMSRSATAAAAYLMTALSIPPDEAVDIIRSKRPVVDPSETFWHQLALFHSADGRVSLRDRETRQFYMERTTTRFMNRGGQPDISHMAKYPATPTASSPPTPIGSHGKRKIRCKMCRRHLAVREHMMDHILEQSPASRPRTPSIGAVLTPLTPQDESESGPRQRRPSVVSDIINPLTGLPGARSRHASMSGGRPDNFSITPQDTGSVPTPRSRSIDVTASGFGMTSMHERSESPIGLEDTDMSRSGSMDQGMGRVRRKSSLSQMHNASNRQLRSAEQIYAHLPPQLAALRMAQNGGVSGGAVGDSPPSSPERETQAKPQYPPNHPLAHLHAAQSKNEGARGAARRMSMLALTPTEGTSPIASGTMTASRERRGSGFGFGGEIATGGPPILVNPKCSGYFVEPLTWMEPVLASGQISGKLVCPNEKCGAKIGNYDWAGVQCGCKEWVTPGFCISRSKVDEVW